MIDGLPMRRSAPFGCVSMVLALTMAGSAVQAGGLAWDRFEAACLAPMLDFEPAQTVGFVKTDAPHWIDGSDGYTYYSGVRRHTLVAGVTETGAPACGMVATAGSGSDLVPEFDAWSREAQAAARVEAVQDRTFETLTHEPRISVELLPETDTRGPMIWVTQTDKES